MTGAPLFAVVTSGGWTKPSSYSVACQLYERICKLARRSGAIKGAKLVATDGRRVLLKVRSFSTVVARENWDGAQ